MKKSILLAALLAVSTSVMAEGNFAHIQYAFRDTVSSNSQDPNRQGVNFTFGTKVYPGVTLDINNQFRTERLNSDTGSSSNRLEAGLTGQFDVLKDVAVYGRGALGQKFATSEDHTYYSLEGGVKTQVTPDLNVRVAYRFRDSFNDTYADKTNTIRLGAEYALNKTSALTLGIDRAYGDSEFIGYNAGYVVKF
jgi:hypothetical protein